MKLNELNIGDCAKVNRLEGKGPIRARLMDMGFVRNAPLELVRQAPLNGPLEVRIKGAFISLRPEEAQLIEVFPIRRRLHNHDGCICGHRRRRGFFRKLFNLLHDDK